MQNFQYEFYGKKIMYCDKEAFDKLTLNDMKDVDVAMSGNFASLPHAYAEAISKCQFIDSDLNYITLCSNTMFGYAKQLIDSNNQRLKDSFDANQIHRIIFEYRNQELCLYIEKTHIIIKNIYYQEIGYFTENDMILNKEKHCNYKHTYNDNDSYLVECFNERHWITKKGANNHISRNKEDNVYDIIEDNQDEIRVKATFFKKGVGYIDSCGNRAFAIGQFLYNKYNKTIVVIDNKDNKYYINKNSIKILMLDAALNAVYKERNELVCLISKMFPSFIAEQDASENSYDKDFKYIVYIDLNGKQLSWHLKNEELINFNHLEIKKGNFWDGSNTEEKYNRIKNFKINS